MKSNKRLFSLQSLGIISLAIFGSFVLINTIISQKPRTAELSKNSDLDLLRDQEYGRVITPTVKLETRSRAIAPRIKFGLRAFYQSENFYKSILKNSKKGSSDDPIVVDPYVEPYLGWKTGGKPAANPTKVAANGLYAILNGNVEVAKSHSQWLIDNSITQNNAIFFPFKFDFAPYYPYSVKAPWNSGLTQGLALGLFSYLYKETNEDKYLNIANQIYRSYLIPIEEGGFTRFEEEGVFFEEYPTEVPTRVLNGAVVAMLGLHDYALITNNPEANKLFQQSVDRLASLLPEYETKDPTTGILLSSYSLARTRPEVLGRFVSDGNALLSEMKLIGINNQDRKELYSVQIDENQDTDVTNNFYLYINKYMNWGPVINETGNFRLINGRKGEYNHSPFKFVLSPENNFKKYEIEVTYKPLTNNKINVQLYDEKEYWNIGNLAPKTKNKKIQVQRFTIPVNFIKSWLEKQNNSPKIDENYLDDNQILIELLGNITGSNIFSNYADRWQDSTVFVPSRYFNNLSRSILLVNSTPSPILGLLPNSVESKHVEYPSVIKVNDKYLMYYSAHGDDKKWRIFLATSDDGLKFKRHGQVFDVNNLPKNCQGNQAFPFVIQDIKKSNSFLMYFSCASKPGKAYDNILWASSLDGKTWEYGGIAIEASGLDPLVILQPTNKYVMFYTIAKNGKTVIQKSTSDNGKDWSIPSTVIAGQPARGFYTKLTAPG
ncbi:MAG: D-glucuronyl C5-epimerase family protein [Nostocaceae cyanobacterium]|nr:D-glucuronyl C5-epimerase family protein [Nostocaceae cyanobacterium]